MTVLRLAPGEAGAVAWALTYFFSLLCGYYILRPIRDEMGIAGGVENLQWLFLGTFLAMLAVVPLFGWLTSRFPRKRFLPYAYAFFILNLLLFYALFRSDAPLAWTARAFYIWVSVFNLFVVSVFWSFMTDLFDDEQARRLFGLIAAGGSAGALAGPLLTAALVERIGIAALLPISAGFLGVAVICIHRLGAMPMRGSDDPSATVRLQGGVWDGIRLVLRSRYLLGICLLIALYSTLATFLYFQQAQIVRDALQEPAARTALFARMDFAVNTLTVTFQVFFTGRIVSRLGLPRTLALIPLLLCAGFLALAYAPVLAVLVVVQVLRRAGNYAIMKPAREMLYVVLSREEKYKAKNFIDTAVYRGSDAAAAWVYAGLKGLGLQLAHLALIAAPFAVLWAWVSHRLGREHDRLRAGAKEKSR